MREVMTGDEKSKASIILGEVVRQTANNYPDSRFRPHLYQNLSSHYTIAGIDPKPYRFWATADGIGTKPELAERLYKESIINERPAPEVFESLPFDLLAMTDGDDARFGRYTVGAAEIVDTNKATDEKVIEAFARGLKAACDEGEFALVNGETAELGYRTGGYGDARLNWNAVGLSLINPKKLILGDNLQPGQTVVAFREKSIRSNGLSKARKILEAAYLLSLGLTSKEEYMVKKLHEKGVIFDDKKIKINDVLSEIFGHDALEQVLPPWHKIFPDITKQLLMPSKLYGPIIREAQGKIDEPRRVEIIAAAHITGGGIPEKVMRMLKDKGLGVDLDPVFADPEAVTSLLKLADTFPEEVKKKVDINDFIACKDWNRGIGFTAVVKNKEDARKLIEIAGQKNCEAAIAGKIISKPEINWRDHTWEYIPFGKRPEEVTLT
jgi:phosphoribosylaminoimidazole (AIR) synthetase